MIAHTRAAGLLVRKDPVEFVHPLVRVHPVTKEKCLFLNGEFITGIQGMKDAEGKVILEFLLNHLITSHDLQARYVSIWCTLLLPVRCNSILAGSAGNRTRL